MPIAKTKLRTPTRMFGYTAILLKYAVNLDEGKGVISSYVEDVTFRCHMNQSSMSETIEDHGADSTYIVKCYCDNTLDVDDRDRVRYQGSDYNIVGAENNGIFRVLLLELS